MIIRENQEEYYGVCDRCHKETPVFSYWSDRQYYMIDNGWVSKWNPKTQETSHICPDCKSKV